MLHFLLQNNRKQIIIEYILRVLIFLLFFAFAASIVLTAFFLPSVFFADYKYNTVNNQTQSANLIDANKYENSASLLKKINVLTTALSYGKSTSTLDTNLIDKIISLKNANIYISSISILSDESAHVENVSLSGISGDRDDLTLFYNDLKSDGSFQNVVLPVSNLIEDANAPFTITFSYTAN